MSLDLTAMRDELIKKLWSFVKGRAPKGSDFETKIKHKKMVLDAMKILGMLIQKIKISDGDEPEEEYDLPKTEHGLRKYLAELGQELHDESDAA